MKRTISIILAIALVFSLGATAFAANETASDTVIERVDFNALEKFADAPSADKWDYPGLNCAVANDVMNGHNGKIRPDDYITRAELTAMVVRVLKAFGDKADLSGYGGMLEGKWYYEALQSGVAVRIIEGTFGHLYPDESITREQAFSILARTFALSAKDKSAKNAFADAGSVSSWSEDYINALIEAKVIIGDSNNKIRPGDNVTRSEFAIMLYRLLRNYTKAGEDYTGKTIDGSVIITDASVILKDTVINGDLIISDAVGLADIDLSNVTVNGRIVIRSGNVKLGNGTKADAVVAASPIREITITGDENFKTGSLEVGERSANVKADVNADNVIVNADGINAEIMNGIKGMLDVNGSANTITIKSNFSEIRINEFAEKNIIIIDKDAEAENAEINGRNNTIRGGGSLKKATINGSGSKVETEGTAVVDNTEEKPAPKPDDNTPDVATGRPSGPKAVVKNGTYITYTTNGTTYNRFYADVSNNTVKFDFKKLSDSVGTKNITFDKIYVETNEVAHCRYDGLGISFKTNEEVALENLLDQLRSHYNWSGAMIPIEENEAKTLANLADKMDLAKDRCDAGWTDLFTERGITVTSALDATFKGYVGSADMSFRMVIPQF